MPDVGPGRGKCAQQVERQYGLPRARTAVDDEDVLAAVPHGGLHRGQDLAEDDLLVVEQDERRLVRYHLRNVFQQLPGRAEPALDHLLQHRSVIARAEPSAQVLGQGRGIAAGEYGRQLPDGFGCLREQRIVRFGRVVVQVGAGVQRDPVFALEDIAAVHQVSPVPMHLRRRVQHVPQVAADPRPEQIVRAADTRPVPLLEFHDHGARAESVAAGQHRVQAQGRQRQLVLEHDAVVAKPGQLDHRGQCPERVLPRAHLGFSRSIPEMRAEGRLQSPGDRVVGRGMHEIEGRAGVELHGQGLSDVVARVASQRLRLRPGCRGGFRSHTRGGAAGRWNCGGSPPLSACRWPHE